MLSPIVFRVDRIAMKPETIWSVGPPTSARRDEVAQTENEGQEAACRDTREGCGK